ncbi:MAG: Fe-S oxidoreductase [uncultured bacterium]|nr:MAG: Fe-S oxidoreductase [uncultured bacterium]
MDTGVLNCFFGGNMNQIMKKEVVGEIYNGDRLTFVPHRLLQLGEDKIAVISENSSGWCVTNIEDYLQIKDFFSKGKVVFDNSFGDKRTDFVQSLWRSDLLEKNGTCLSQLIQPFPSVLLVLKITGNCNFNCSYCYDYSDARVGTIIPIDKVKETISYVLSQNRGLNIVMHGGEPLLHFPLIKEIVEFTVKAAGTTKRTNFFIQTNGSLFSKEVVAFLDKYNFFVGLSLDGMTEKSNACRAVKSGATCLEIFNKNIKEYGKFLRRRAGIVCTLSQRNLEEFPNFVLWLQDLGIGGITISPLVPAGKGAQTTSDLISSDEYIKLLDVLINMIKTKEIERISVESINKFVSSLVGLQANDLCHSNPCGAGGDFLAIDSKGNYRACDCVYHDYFLLDNKTTCIFNTRSKLLNRREYMKNHACVNCAIFGLCGGGCIAEAITNTGVAEALPEKSCKVKKFFYRTLLKEYAFDKERPLFAYYSRLAGVKSRLNEKAVV